MAKLKLPTFILAVILTAIPLEAWAQSPICAERADVLKQLSHKYAEHPVAMGLATSGAVVEILAADTGATFTIIITPPRGPSCLIVAGEMWETLPLPKKGEGL